MLSGESMKSRRREAAGKRRRIIFNDDGGSARRRDDPLADPAAFLADRTTPLIGSQVDTIQYCTTAGTFGRFYHRSQVAEVADDTRGRYEHSAIPGLIARGTDPLELVTEFCRNRDFEVFWSLRINDTHDAANPLLFSKLKEDHPDWLFGTPEDPPVHGKWSAIDFGQPAVRDLVVSYIEDVLDRYRVDGIDLDFFRHPVFFKTQGRGGSIEPREIETMTGLIARVRSLLDRKTIEQNRETPLLLSILVPDSLEYCLAVGLDVEHWLASGYIDFLETTGYFRLNPWQYSVELGHRFDVPVYGCLSEPRLKDRRLRAERFVPEVYRARAMQIWEAGADGICMYNYFDASSSLYREIGEPDLLSRLNKTYYVSGRGKGSPAGNPVPYDAYQHIPTLSPDYPVTIAPGESYATQLIIGEDIEAIAADGALTSAVCEISANRHDPDSGDAARQIDASQAREWLTLDLNGTGLSAWCEVDGWLRVDIAPEAIVTGLLYRGENTISLHVAPDDERIVHRAKTQLRDIRLRLCYRA